MKKTESVISTIVMLMLLILSHKILVKYSIAGISLYDLIKLPLAIWGAFFLYTIVQTNNNKSEYTKSIIAITLGFIVTIFLSTTCQVWYEYLIKTVVTVTGAFLLYLYLRIRNIIE